MCGCDVTACMLSPRGGDVSYNELLIVLWAAPRSIRRLPSRQGVVVDAPNAAHPLSALDTWKRDWN